MTKIEENIIEIAWIDQALRDRNFYSDDVDTLDNKALIIKLAKQFEKDHKNMDWNKKGDYYEAIYEFATEKLLYAFERNSPNIIPNGGWAVIQGGVD